LYAYAKFMKINVLLKELSCYTDIIVKVNKEKCSFVS